MNNTQTKYYTGNSMITRALVVDTKDPLKLGRVKVRVYNLHGHKDNPRGAFIPDHHLPWARPVSLYSSHDSGSYLVPEVGSFVLIAFEDNTESKPFYFGGVYGEGLRYEDRKVGKTDIRERTQPLRDPEIPKEVRDEDTYVLFKSPKGKSFVVDDNDQEESIYLRDQFGQIISLDSVMDTEYAKDLQYKPRHHLDMRNSKFEEWNGLANKCRILLKSLTHSIIQILGSRLRSLITIKSKLGKNESALNLNAESGNNYVLIDITTSSGEKSHIRLDLDKGLDIYTPKSISLHADQDVHIRSSGGTVHVEDSSGSKFQCRGDD